MEYNTNKPTVKESEDNSEINLQQIVEQYAFYWRWFVLSLIICLISAFVYLRYAEKIYSVSTKILLQDEKQASGDLAGLSELTSLAGGGSSTSAFVSDQMDVMKSRRILSKVVESNKLNILYRSKGNVKSSELLEQDSPIKLVILNHQDKRQDSVEYALTITKKNGKLQLKDANQDIDNYSLGQKINSPIGAIMLTPNGSKVISGELVITVRPVHKVVDNYISSVNISPNNEKQSFIVNLSMNHSNREKAALILNSLVNQYDKDVTTDKAKVTRATSDFINYRLDLIAKDLSSTDSKVASYKDRNNLVDMTSEAQLYMQNASENERTLVDYQTQLKLAEMMGDAITDDYALLPSNIGLQDPSIQSSVQTYNGLILEREDLLKSATTDNPIVKNIESNINDIRRSLNTSLSNYRKVLSTNVSSIQSQRNKFEGKLSQLPGQERDFKDISRQQQIFESLYLFLLQKREETEIKASATPANLKIIDHAYGSEIPVSPKRSIILLGSLIAGFLFPFAILYVKFLLDNKIHSRKDIEDVFPAPILGEVPTSEYPIIKDNDRSSLAEAIRILRTNISFMLTKNKGNSSVIYVTSTTSGEGKSFIATNLAKILAMSGKKVLLLGADIRSPKVLDYLGLSHLQHTNIGITQYLINPEMPIKEIIISKPAPYDFDIIYSGYIAPNPAELLMNGHFEDIVNYGRANYDYVIVDTSPVSLVTDTILISEFADLTLYVARANYLDKRLLNVPKELYHQNKLNNMAVVINDVDFQRGYCYGYGYGYGYGDNREKKSNWHKIKSLFKL